MKAVIKSNKKESLKLLIASSENKSSLTEAYKSFGNAIGLGDGSLKVILSISQCSKKTADSICNRLGVDFSKFFRLK